MYVLFLSFFRNITIWQQARYFENMIQKLTVPVSVTTLFDHRTRTTAPRKVLFEGKEYSIKTVDYHHTFRDGRILFHVFSVASEALFFRLVLNTETLSWTLEEVADGESN